MSKPFHLAWFANFRPPAWKGPFDGNDAASHWANGDFFIDFAQSLERAGFDYLMLEDSLMVPDIYAGSAELELKHGIYAPKHDPMPLLPVLARFTKHIGLIATASTTFYPPFLLARLMATMDHLTQGRVGWNIVTSSEDLAAQNFGMKKLPEHDLRYEMAEEFTQVVRQLWDGWDSDAMIMDPVTGKLTDHRKVRPINYEGTYFSSRGPLNTLRPVQGHPVICQAGSSPRGRAFAAKNTDTLLAIVFGVEAMKAYREDMRSRAAGFGRNPDDIKVMYVVAPFIGATKEEAIEKKRVHDARVDENMEIQTLHMAALMEIDLSPFPLDDPLPEHFTTNGHQGTLDGFLTANKGKTLRQALQHRALESVELVGTPDEVASKMQDVMDEVGGDGFLIASPTTRLSRTYINEICNGLAPELQRRGLVRTSYEHKLFRDNLLSF